MNIDCVSETYLEKHLNKLAMHYNAISDTITWAAKAYRRILSHYYSIIIPTDASILEVGCGDGELLSRFKNKDISGIDVSVRQIELARKKVPHGMFYVQAGETINLPRSFDYIIISDTINQAADVQAMLSALKKNAAPHTRLVLNFYNTLWRPLLGLATFLNLRAKQPQSNWLSTEDVKNLLELSDWQVIKTQPRILLPIRLFGIERLINALLSPLLPWFCLAVFCTARLRPKISDPCSYSVSVIIPARNEAGNIEDAINRVPEMGHSTELMFVEGNSQDDTWEIIRQMKTKYPDRKIRILQQSGKMKGNAVREGFAAANGDILMILDADLTMPPEELPKFYDVLASEHAEFANGVRLVYPMQEKAMRFLNMCGNKAFSIIFTWLLNQSIKDTLCGTKVLFRKDYEKIAANRVYFGEFDPFGDFDLLFGAAKLDLKIVDIPIRYHERTYGDTNIQRWRHGWLLLKMAAFAARKLKFI